MATYKSQTVLIGLPKAVHGDAVEAQHILAEANLQTALVAGDVVQLAYYPRWARIVSASLQADQLDTGGAAALSFNVGDTGWTGVDGYGNQQVVAADPQRFFTNTTVGRTNPLTTDTGSTAAFNARARLLRYSGPQAIPAQAGNAGLIQAVVTNAAQTFQAGRLRFLLTYFIDEPRSLQFP